MAWHQPSGSPACRTRSTKRRQQSGVVPAGFTMTGQPTAMAGTTWCTIRLSGWLKALMATTTPIGSHVVNAERPADAGEWPIGTSSPRMT